MLTQAQYQTRHGFHLGRYECKQQHEYKFEVVMTCSGCSGAVSRVLGKLDGQSSQCASFASSRLPALTDAVCCFYCLGNFQQASTLTMSRSKTSLSLSRGQHRTKPCWRRSKRPARRSSLVRSSAEQQLAPTVNIFTTTMHATPLHRKGVHTFQPGSLLQSSYRHIGRSTMLFH